MATPEGAWMASLPVSQNERRKCTHLLRKIVCHRVRRWKPRGRLKAIQNVVRDLKGEVEVCLVMLHPEREIQVGWGCLDDGFKLRVPIQYALLCHGVSPFRRVDDAIQHRRLAKVCNESLVAHSYAQGVASRGAEQERKDTSHLHKEEECAATVTTVSTFSTCTSTCHETG